MQPIVSTLPQTDMTNTTLKRVYFFGRTRYTPALEIKLSEAETLSTPFVKVEEDFGRPEPCWLAEVQHPHPNQAEWSFRINLGHDTYAAPDGHGSFEYYRTKLKELWIQHGQIFNYQPTPAHSLSRVVKIPHFTGTLHRRALYVYLPRGYDQHTDRSYPVLYLHDGQNCFESFVHDSFSGSWRADHTADYLINQGRLRECIIVGVSNGGNHRIPEYLPPYANYPAFLDQNHSQKSSRSKIRSREGRADKTCDYYIHEVAPYIEKYYRALPGRENRAVCGSSMGGLFTMYMAWEYSDFARHYAALSTSFWITRHNIGDLKSPLEMVERLRTGRPRDMRLWLDSGSQDAPGVGNDGKEDTLAAKNALLHNGYVEGPNFHYHLAEGAIHHESAWAGRLDRVLQFLFPLT